MIIEKREIATKTLKESKESKTFVLELDPSVLPKIDNYAKKLNDDLKLLRNAVERSTGSLDLPCTESMQTILVVCHGDKMLKETMLLSDVFSQATSVLKEGKPIIIKPAKEPGKDGKRGAKVTTKKTAFVSVYGLDEFLSDDVIGGNPVLKSQSFFEKEIFKALGEKREVHIVLPKETFPSKEKVEKPKKVRQKRVRKKEVTVFEPPMPVSEHGQKIAQILRSHISNLNRFSRIALTYYKNKKDNRNPYIEPNFNDLQKYSMPDFVLELEGIKYPILPGDPDCFYAEIGFFIEPDENLMQLVPFKWKLKHFNYEYFIYKDTLSEFFGEDRKNVFNLRRINLSTMGNNGEIKALRDYNKKPFGCDLMGIFSQLKLLEHDQEKTVQLKGLDVEEKTP